MALFPINRSYNRFIDPFDNFFGHQLDLFDPWNDFDMIPLSTPLFHWIDQPILPFGRYSALNDESLRMRPVQSEKCRFQLNVAGFNPGSIKTRIDGKKLLVEAKQEDRDGEDYHVRELHKSFNLPEHADVNNLASFVTPNNMMIIEVPIKNPELEQRMLQSRQNDNQLARWGDWRDPLFDYWGFGAGIFSPQVVDTPNGKQLKMSLKMKDFTPDQIEVSVKNNDLVVQGKHEHKDRNRSEKAYFYKSCTLPPGTQLDKLESRLRDDGLLEIEAPFIEQRGQQSSIEQQRGQ